MMVLGGVIVWLILSVLTAWGFCRWKQWEREQDRLAEWRRQERLRWTR